MNFQDENDQFTLGGNTGFGFGNFDPAQIQQDEVIIVVLAIDVSPSIRRFEDDLNSAFKEFIEEFQSSHVADKMMVSILKFNENVQVLTGYQPIKTLDVSKYDFRNSGSLTALYEASYQAIQNAFDYRAQLESTGVNCKVLNFIITDGSDTVGRGKQPSDVKQLIADIMKKEQNMNSFTTILFGIGNDPQEFTSSQKLMGIDHCVTVGTTGKDIRKLIGFISASVSKSASNQPISF